MQNDAMESFTHQIILAGDHLVREAQRLFKPHGISPAQFNVLNLLEIHGDGLRPSEISQRLVVDPASATYLMDQMEKRGWILRADDAKDRRAYRIIRTKAGKEKHAEARVVYRRGLDELVRLVGRPAEVEAAAELVKLVSEAATGSTEALISEESGKPEKAGKPAGPGGAVRRSDARKP